ncbi:MAG TPA: hypothetical protein VG369_04780, partial [Humibacter sp.]|nr:hypothetical protein [Humibacter sp.]
MTTLTDRYVYAVGRRVPKHQRDELELEVRALVTDTAEAKREEGASDPERDAITELGDPERLAATYTDRPLQLIGPALFPAYRRTMVLLYSLVPPIAVLVMVVVQAFARDDVGDIIGSAIALAIQVCVHVGFWTTLVFVILERVPREGRGIADWTPDMLPDPDAGERGLDRGGLIGGILWGAFIIAAVFWQQFASPIRTSTGDSVPVLNPQLWTFWLPWIIVVMALQVAFTVFVYSQRRWTYPLALGRIVLDIAFLVPVAWLALSGGLLNSAFFAAVHW